MPSIYHFQDVLLSMVDFNGRSGSPVRSSRQWRAILTQSSQQPRSKLSSLLLRSTKHHYLLLIVYEKVDRYPCILYCCATTFYTSWGESLTQVAILCLTPRRISILLVFNNVMVVVRVPFCIFFSLELTIMFRAYPESRGSALGRSRSARSVTL